MSQLLEVIMLICFGFSWPISAYKNYKVRTAKYTSVYFILLIIAGYIAGIAAKICDHNYTYVLAVYVLNLLMVSINLIIYFRNKSIDKKSDVECEPEIS